MSTYGSNNAEYLTARIVRDRPDILERMKRGEFRSIRAAAIEAGIVKPEFHCPFDPTGASRAIRGHFQGDDLKTLIDLLSQ